jgi:hypothetical protein
MSQATIEDISGRPAAECAAAHDADALTRSFVGCVVSEEHASSEGGTNG